ncbi:MAG: hypothetical protein EPN75_05835 [Beijerinckiaceae bacterium]|nr:MAG: hypothetical protein EPN75_05835 [Beijerinckiaceae bacterium]
MTGSQKAPVHPYLVLLAAILLPGAGHMLMGVPKRGLVMQMYMIALGWITWHLTTPHQSLVGRLAGGLFIYAMSVLDAYRIARLTYAKYQKSH